MGQKFDAVSFAILKVLQRCEIEQLPYYLVDDKIFPLKDWLMCPYSGLLSEAKMLFNHRLSRARLTIENAFGVLDARWIFFFFFFRTSCKNVVRYVMAVISLHNYLRQTKNVYYCPTGFVDSED